MKPGKLVTIVTLVALTALVAVGSALYWYASAYGKNQALSNSEWFDAVRRAEAGWTVVATASNDRMRACVFESAGVVAITYSFHSAALSEQRHTVATGISDSAHNDHFRLRAGDGVELPSAGSMHPASCGLYDSVYYGEVPSRVGPRYLSIQEQDANGQVVHELKAELEWARGR
ncbi:MAG: hypothetical protein EPO68_16595 [Planctomycetota bacterium]|nr:MAG: hypothetical protein EPO68_16595 [Planctomycetota bacterium]